ncbi:MAG: flagellar export chaperone FliS [Nitrospiraceae bacterium]|nr:flagellar export chaperone FliS [Nitrospiraceae bacterium]
MTNLNYAMNAYTKTMVNTAPSKVDLVIMLYDGAIEFLHKAMFYMGQKDIQKKLHYMDRAIAIVNELLNSLNMKEGGQVAQNLHGLYIHMLRELALANIRNDPERISRVQGLLRTLREGWRGIK